MLNNNEEYFYSIFFYLIFIFDCVVKMSQNNKMGHI